MTFPAFDKIPRLNRDVVITEKIDGTNALVRVSRFNLVPGEKFSNNPIRPVASVGDLHIYAGSRNRWIFPEGDNFGFAKYVEQNAEGLATTLGEGDHYGEWWGVGIQRNYGMRERRFSLFNTHRWSHLDGTQVDGLHVVPQLYHGPLMVDGLNMVQEEIARLRDFGSVAAPGFLDPEGIVMYHEAGRHYYKATIKDDEKPKG